MARHAATTTPPRAASPDVARAARRQRIGAINRRIGWVMLPLIVTACAIHYGPGGEFGTRNSMVVALQWVYAPLTLLHAGLSFYVFGWVPPARTLLVFHIWFGYAYLLLVLASPATFGIEPLHGLLTMAMFTCLAVHVGIGIRFARRRRLARP